MTRLAVIGAIVVVLAGSAVALFVATRDDGTDGTPTLEVVQEDDGRVDYDYVIPAGTQDAKLRGEAVEIMPATLDVEVGETIRIRNDDEAGAFAGIFYVGAGEEVSMRFTTPGELSGACDLNSSGEFTITVADPAR